MRSKTVILALATLTGLAVQAQGAEPSGQDPQSPAPSWAVINPGDLHWKIKDTLPQKPSPAHAAVAWGDPPTGAYAFFGKFPAGFTVPTHWHTNDVLVVMTKNSMVITPEGGAPREIQEAASSRCRPR
jgi:hypothetical protein